MNRLLKLGGIAAIYEAVAYVIGILFFILIVDITAIETPLENVALLVENQTSMLIMTFLIMVIWGFAMIVLALALYQRLRSASPARMQIATVIGVFWACVIIINGMIFHTSADRLIELYRTNPDQAASLWLSLDTIRTGLAGGNEFLGGIWMLLVSSAALSGNVFPKALNYLGLGVGIAGVISIVPPVAEIFIFIFAFSQIVWFVWLGKQLISEKAEQSREEPQGIYSKLENVL
ncbi:MAG: DUF4386 family protein [Chloroflexota bacterium]